MIRRCGRCRRRAHLLAAIERARVVVFAEQLEHVRALKLALGQPVLEPLEFPSVPTFRRVR